MSFDLTFSAMAARSDRAPANWRRPFLKWLDSIDNGWGIPRLILLFVMAWTVFFLIAYLGADLHPDVLETWTLGRTFEWGNAKHPPLMGWVTWGWTSVFPLTNWSLQLMSMVNSGLALWCVDLISRRFVKGDKRAMILLLLMLLPSYQFHAQRFNANSVLLAIWPLATYCFLRSFETRRFGWAVAAGATAAVAMLGKYYSIFLVGSFAFAAICHPQRLNYLRSVAPWVSMVAGFFVLGPHLHWLINHGGEPFDYALAHAGAPVGQAVIESTMFIAGIAATLALPALTWMLTAGIQLRNFRRDFHDLDAGLWLLFLILVGTIAFPVITSIVMGTDLPSLWAHQGLFLPAILAVCGASFPIRRFYIVNTAVLVFTIAFIAIIVGAPAHAIYRNNHPYEEGRNFYRSTALELTRQWHQHSDTPLARVSGDDSLAFAVAFYSPDHPVYARTFAYQYPWGLPRPSTLRKGWVGVCFGDNVSCVDLMAQVHTQAPKSVLSEFSVQSMLAGHAGAVRRVTALIVPPEL